MTDASLVCFTILFPLAIFAGGIYFLYRAAGLLSLSSDMRRAASSQPAPGAFTIISGKPSEEGAIKSFLGEHGCIYSRLHLEFLDPKRNVWMPLRTFERRAAFTLSGYAVDPSGAEFSVKGQEVYQEPRKEPPPKEGLMGELGQFSRHTGGGRMSYMLYPASRAEPYGTAFDAKPFDSRFIEDIAEDPEVGELLKQYWYHRKRATLQTIRGSDDVVVVGTIDGQGTSIRKAGNRFLISSEDIKAVLRQDDGKAWASVLIGLGLVMASMVVSVILLFF